MVFAYDNNHYDGFATLMTREEFDDWKRHSDGDEPRLAEVERVVGGKEALARGETSGRFRMQ